LGAIGRPGEAIVASCPAKIAALTLSRGEKISQRFQWISFHDSLTIPTLGSPGNRAKPGAANICNLSSILAR
jgi:hypothetical protein